MTGVEVSEPARTPTTPPPSKGPSAPATSFHSTLPLTVPPSDHRGCVRVGVRRVIDDVDVDLPGRGAAIDILGHHVEVLGDAVGTVGIRVVAVVTQRVAVAHHAGRRVVTGDGEGRAGIGLARLRETCRHASGDHGDAAHGEGLQAIRRVDGEGAGLGQRRCVRVGAVGEVFLVDGQFAATGVEAVEGRPG